MTNLKKISFDGKKARLLVLGLLLTGLGACVEPQAAAPVQPIEMPEALIDVVIDRAVATEIVKRCPTEFRVKKAGEVAAIVRLAKSNPEIANYSDAEIGATTRTKALKLRAQNEIVSYVTKRKILLSDNRTWCAAGRYETANKTAIGAHLTQK